MFAPWSHFPRAECLPDCSCEFMHLDAWIAQPLAFWSSLAYMVAAYCLHRKVKAHPFGFRLWNFVLILLGLSSLLTHATFTKVAVGMDFASIVAVLSFFTFLQFFQMLRFPPLRVFHYFMIYYALLFSAFYSMNKWTKIGICVLIFFLSLGETVRSMGLKFLKARDLQLSIGILTFSFSLFLLDDHRVGCDPQGYLHGHTLWHLGTAVSAYYYGKWRFLKEERNSKMTES